MRVKKRQSSGSASEPATPVDIQPYQEGEMTNQLQGSAPGMVCTGDDPAELVDKLTAAIQAGNASAAATLVAEISKHRLKLDINIPKEDVEQCGIEKEFSVRVHVEDRVAAGCFMNLTVKASDTILDLKRKVMLKYNFPMQVQRWIIGKKIPEDKEKLSKCGIKGPGHTLYLYLVTARSMGLSREDYETQRQAMLEGRIPSPVYQPNLLSGTDRSSDQMSWPSPLSPSEAKSRAYSNSQSPVRASSPVSLPDGGHDGNEHQGLASRQGSRKSLSSGTSLIHEMLSLVGSQGTLVNSESMYSEPRVSIGNEGAVGLRSRTPPHSEKETEAEGWSCPACTYINPPTRPGCRMCSGPRPSNYQVPPNYKMTTEEVDFMENQQRLERMTREAVPLSRPPDLLNQHQADQVQRRPSSNRITSEQLGETLQLIQALNMHEQDSRKSSSGNNQVVGNQLSFVSEGSQWNDLHTLPAVPGSQQHLPHLLALNARGSHRNLSPARLLSAKAPAGRQASPISFYDTLIAEPPNNDDEGYPTDDENSQV